MTTVLCTLYNSLYLDKGLVLYDSLCKCAKDFKLYVLCMDDKSYEILADLNQEHHIPVRLSDFEMGDDALLEAKGNRPMGEYCWTCSSSFIRYILKYYGEKICTYVDADMYFYGDPQILIDEMVAAGKSVMVVPHRFPDNKNNLAKIVGEYCVEFNSFMNTPDSLEALEYWRGRCLECCSNLGDGTHWGDQKYLDALVERFSCVYVCDNPGAGIAPWNILSYSINNGIIFFNGEKIDCFFYHFQGLSYLNNRYVSIGIQKNRAVNQLISNIYHPYLTAIYKKKQLLNQQYGIDLLIYSHPTLKGWKHKFKQSQLGRVLRFFSLRIRAGAIVLRVSKM